MFERVCKSFGRTDYYTVRKTKYGECEYLERIELDKGYFLWKVRADYRPRVFPGSLFYVVAKSYKQACERFDNLITWLDVRSIDQCSEEEMHGVLDRYGEHYLIVI